MSSPRACSGPPHDDRKSLRRLGYYPLRKNDQGIYRHFPRNFLRRQGPQGSRRHARSQASPRPVEVMTIHDLVFWTWVADQIKQAAVPLPLTARGDRPSFGRSATAHRASQSVAEAESAANSGLSEKNPGHRACVRPIKRRVSPTGFKKVADARASCQHQVTRQLPRLTARRRPTRGSVRGNWMGATTAPGWR